MSSEYVRLSESERVYGAKNLLKSQVSTLQLVKNFRRYELLRKEELTLKIEFKTKLQYLLSLVDSLGKVLPKISHKEVDSKEGKGLFDEFRRKEDEKMKNLDEELDEIKRKLEALK